MNQTIMERLCAPFPFELVEAKIQVSQKEKGRGMAVFYLDSRAIQNRLDEVVGAFGWTNNFSLWHGNSQICGISIFDPERNEWVTKHDGAENSDIEAIKGGLTDAFKRAAVLWGIGRYLYQIDGIWVDVDQRGNSSFIKDNQQGKLKAAYDAAVKRLFGDVSNQQPLNREGANQNQQAPKQEQNPADGAIDIAQGSAAKASNPENAANMGKANNIPSPCDFKIHSITPSGKSSQLLKLFNREGEVVTGYIKSIEQGIVVGTQLRNVQIEEKTGLKGISSAMT